MFATTVQLGPFRFPTYATLLGLGLVGGVLISAWQGQRRGLAPIRPFDAALLAALGAWVGARAAYVGINWAYFHNHLSEALRPWAGGLAWQGGWVVGLLSILCYGRYFRVPLGRLLDALAWGMAWFTLCVWLGSGVVHDVYGRETWPNEGLWWRLSDDLPDLYGLRAPRINVPLLGILWSGLIFVSLGLFGKTFSRPGLLFSIYLGLTGLGGLALVPLQANPAPYLLHVRLDWWFNLALVVAGLVGLILTQRRRTNPSTMLRTGDE